MESAAVAGGSPALQFKEGLLSPSTEPHSGGGLRVALGVDDQARADKALKGIAGKRLTYRSPLINGRPASEQKPWRHPRFKARWKAKN